MNKPVLGLTETIVILSNGNAEKVKAKIDTGATKSSIDTDLAIKLKLGPIVETKLVKSAQGNSIRPVVHASIILAGKKFDADFTLAERSHMKYSVLIGQNILKRGFLVDPSKKEGSFHMMM
jgi:hypothetical protein